MTQPNEDQASEMAAEMRRGHDVKVMVPHFAAIYRAFLSQDGISEHAALEMTQTYIMSVNAGRSS